MPKYRVQVQETATYVVEVTARNLKQAEAKAVDLVAEAITLVPDTGVECAGVMDRDVVDVEVVK